MNGFGIIRAPRKFLQQIRAPAYTGENRCIPCTIVNLSIAVVLGIVIATVSTAGAILAVTAMVVVIYLRGYLVPGTPSFTQRYLPDWILAYFDHSTLQAGEETQVDPERLLVEARVLVEETDGQDLELAPAFEERWRDRFDVIHDGSDRSGLAGLAELVGLPEERLDVENHDSGFVAWVEERRVGQWESLVAFHSDIAANLIMPAFVSGWESLSLASRSNTLGALRLFIDQCPACDGLVRMEADVKRSCCRDIDVIATTCLGCGERLFEAVYDPMNLVEADSVSGDRA